MLGGASGAGVIACGGPQAPESPANVRYDGEGVPAWLPKAAEQCVRIAACSRTAVTISECVEDLGAGRSPCLQQASTCAQVEACGHDVIATRAAEYCKTHPGVLSACADNLWVTCGETPEQANAQDCTRIGAGRCVETRATGGLLMRGCASTTLCPSGAPETRCDGARHIISCHDGLAERSECPAGSTCSPDAEGPKCVSQTSARCGTSDQAFCVGDTLVECPGSQRTQVAREIDCAAIGLRCVTSGRDASCHVGVMNDCAGGAARCEGDDLVVCAAGRQRRISCAKLGFTKCDPTRRGLEAACAP
jgi:hypothetical protein